MMCVILFFIAAYVNVYGGNRDGAVTFSMGSGIYDFASKRQIDNTSVPFAALGYQFNPHWGIEGLLGIFNTDSHDPDDNCEQVNGTLVALDGIYHFSPYTKLEPFVLAGFGILGMNPNGSNAHNLGNINAGIGAQIFADTSVALRFEARDFYTIVGGFNDLYFDAGLSFLWG